MSLGSRIGMVAAFAAMLAGCGPERSIDRSEAPDVARAAADATSVVWDAVSADSEALEGWAVKWC